MNLLGLFAKQPVAGRVKTRLSDSLGPELAAQAAEAFLTDLVERFQRTSDCRVVCHAPGTGESSRWFSGLVQGRYDLWPQCDGDLGERLSKFFEQAFAFGAERVVVIGSDSPTLPKDHVDRAFEALRDHDCVLGPATDGGYYLVGHRAGNWPTFRGIAWSTGYVLEQTVARLREAKVSLAVLPPWYDVDTLADWRMLRGHLWAQEMAGEPMDSPATRRVLGLDSARGEHVLM